MTSRLENAYYAVMLAKAGKAKLTRDRAEASRLLTESKDNAAIAESKLESANAGVAMSSRYHAGILGDLMDAEKNLAARERDLEKAQAAASDADKKALDAKREKIDREGKARSAPTAAELMESLNQS